jgi:aldose 1-epimerase
MRESRSRHRGILALAMPPDALRSLAMPARFWVPVLGFLVAGVVSASRPAAQQGRYAVARDGDTVRLSDRAAAIVVSILPSLGNIAYEMSVHGHNVLRNPHPTVEAFKARPNTVGIPFMGPWANRLDEQAFYANGKRYPFDMALGNVRGQIPIHGFLTLTDKWQVVETKATAAEAFVTSRLEFSKQPDWMKQWPFAHTVEMTYRLKDGALEVATAVANLSAEPMPLAVGYHPHFQLTDSKRDEWMISVPAKKRWLLSPQKLPTGETEPIEKFFTDPANAAVKDYDLDDVFSDLTRDAPGRATMTLKGKAQKLDVIFGPNWKVGVIWAPRPPAGQERNFLCFEPMAGITNAVNMAHKGTYSELQVVAPGATWRESWWVKPSGFTAAPAASAGVR